MYTGESRMRGGHRIWRCLCVDSRDPVVGLEPMNHEIMTWAEIGCLTNWDTQGPLRFFFVNLLISLHFQDLLRTPNSFYLCEFQLLIYTILEFETGKNWISFKILTRGAWLAQSEEHVTLDLGVISSSPTWGVEITYINKTLKQYLLIHQKIKLIAY